MGPPNPQTLGHIDVTEGTRTLIEHTQDNLQQEIRVQTQSILDIQDTINNLQVHFSEMEQQSSTQTQDLETLT